MNRAWIPAGALAGVSVAGLIALGPLTKSMGTSVSYPPPITSQQSGKPGGSHELRAVSLSVNAGLVGNTTTNRARGSQALATTNTNSNEGLVGLHIHKATPSKTGPATSRTGTTTSKPKKPVKQPVKAPRKSISTSGETNDSAGLAGNNNGSVGPGEQSQTPSSDGP